MLVMHDRKVALSLKEGEIDITVIGKVVSDL